MPDFDTYIPFHVVMENYKNAPQYLYGLTPSQMDMFMTEDNPVQKQSERVTEVLILYLLILSKWIWCYNEKRKK